MRKVERILSATEGSSTSAGAVAKALQLVQHFGAALYVVHVAHLAFNGRQITTCSRTPVMIVP